MAKEEPASGHAAIAVWEQHRHRVELLAAIAQQIRTPLALVLGFGKLLATRDCSPEQVRDVADEIQRGAKRMAVLLNELLDAAGPMPLPAPAEALALGEDRSDEIDRLVERLGAAEQRSAALASELAEARLAQQQLETYADDFRRTYAEARRLLQQMTALYEVSTGIGATVDPSEVLARTTKGLRRLLPSDGAAIYLLDEDRRVARRQAFAFPDGLDEPPKTAARDRGPLGRCLAQGQMVLEGPRAAAVERRNPTWTLALPLLAGSQQLGALLLVRPGSQPFSEEERHLAEMVASQTAMAVQNARLAATDGLTGLYNRRYFEQALAFECDRARRVGRPLGLLMVDIDHFKRFNESYGHPAGDEVLRMVAATLAGQLRRTDIVARLGGEEFAAILPENNNAAVGVAAERLRRAIEEHPSPIHEGRELPGVRVSVGGAALPAKVVAPRPLIRAADGALRQAKRAGRNRSVIARAACDNDRA